MAVKEMLRFISECKTEGMEQVNILVICNIVLQPYMTPALTTLFLRENIDIRITYVMYVEEGYEQKENYDICIVWYDYEMKFSDLSLKILEHGNNELFIMQAVNWARGVYSCISEKGNIPIIWMTLEEYENVTNNVTGYLLSEHSVCNKININIYNELKDNVIFVDIGAVIKKIGINEAYDCKARYRINCGYSLKFVQYISKEILKQYQIIKGNVFKCIVVDCDNVLWGGIISEEKTNIVLSDVGQGRIYQDFQRFLLALYYHGIILTVASKNDNHDIQRVFETHHGMVLKKEHIACFEVNWNNKAESILKIANKLNIGLESMIFIDDSSNEIDLINKTLPKVNTILFNINTIYGEMAKFNVPISCDLNNILLRTKTYQENVKRFSLLEECIDYDKYLEELYTQIKIRMATDMDCDRISELSMRTNKCTNGKRYTYTDIKIKLKTKKYYLYTVTVSDRLGNLGLVGAIGIDNAIIDMFCLSCRALGRNVEKTMVSYIYKNHDIEDVVFIDTLSNNKLKEFLLDNNSTLHKN